MTHAEVLSNLGFDALTAKSFGRYSTQCPSCSPNRRKQKERCCTVWVDADRVGWNCHHCGWKGNHFLDGEFHVEHKGDGFNSPIKTNILYVDRSVMEASTDPKHYPRNKLYQWFTEQLSADDDYVIALFQLYNVGTNKQGYPVFWLVDQYGNVRQPKIIPTDPVTGKRIKDSSDMGVPKGFSTDFGYKPCIFGEHLLGLNYDVPVIVTEGEKDALCAAIMNPHACVIALGGSGAARLKTCGGLYKRELIVFPDCDAGGQKMLESVLDAMPNALCIEGFNTDSGLDPAEEFTWLADSMDADTLFRNYAVGGGEIDLSGCTYFLQRGY